MLVPLQAYAYSQVTSRSAVVGESAPSAQTTYTVNWTTPSSEPTATQDVQFQICTSPLQGSCSLVTGATFVGGAFAAGSSSAHFTSGWSQGTGGNCGIPSTTAYCIIDASGVSLGASTAQTVVVNTVTNPSTPNQEYYLQITTYSATNNTGLLDYGAIALGTGTTLAVTANVQESLLFTVGSTNCTTGTGPVNVGTGGNNVLTAGTTSGAYSYECVNTNASHGYQLAYIATQAGAPCPNGGTNGAFTNCLGTSHDFYDATTATSFTTGTGAAPDGDYFGMDIVANTGNVNGDSATLTGNNPTGGVAPTYDSGGAYSTTDKFAWAHNAVTNLAHEASGPTATTTYQSTYEAQAGSLTPSGQYKVDIDYLCTSTY
jgi:hypothetical protein